MKLIVVDQRQCIVLWTIVYYNDDKFLPGTDEYVSEFIEERNNWLFLIETRGNNSKIIGSVSQEIGLAGLVVLKAVRR